MPGDEFAQQASKWGTWILNLLFVARPYRKQHAAMLGHDGLPQRKPMHRSTDTKNITAPCTTKNGWSLTHFQQAVIANFFPLMITLSILHITINMTKRKNVSWFGNDNRNVNINLWCCSSLSECHQLLGRNTKPNNFQQDLVRALGYNSGPSQT